MAKKKIESPQEQLEKSIKRIKALMSLGAIKSWDVLFKHIGREYPAFRSKTFGFDTFKELERILFEELSHREPTVTAPTVETIPQSKYADLVKPILPARNPLQKTDPYYFQLHACEEMWYKLKVQSYRAFLLRVNTGLGKTFAVGQMLRWLVDDKYFHGKSISPFPILCVAPVSVLEQTRRVLVEHFGLDDIRDFFLTNYAALRSSLGERFFLDQVDKHIDGEFVPEWKWKPVLHPMIFWWDENHNLKNDESEQSKIAQAVNEINSPHVIQFFSSATPFSKVSQAKTFAVATRIPYSYGLAHNVPLNNELWPVFAKEIAEGDPYAFSPRSIKNLLHKLAPYIITFKNVRQKHKSIDSVEEIDFDSPESQQRYQTAFLKYLERKRKLQGEVGSAFLILVELSIFRQAAEGERVRILARRMYESVQNGKAALCACAYKATIAKVVNILYNDYNVPREQISLIWGGNPVFSGKGKKYSQEEMKDIIERKLRGENVPDKVLKAVYKQFDFESTGLADLPEHLKLGPQSRIDRQREIDKFQSGKSLYCLYTHAAGGAGLSLHQDKPSLRPRVGFHTPTYNEMEVTQSFGRGHRFNSLSDTDQRLLLFRGTIEVDVLATLNFKNLALNEVIRHGQFEAEARAIRGNEDIEELTENQYEEMEKEIEQ